MLTQDAADVTIYKGELVDPLSDKPGSEVARNKLLSLLDSLLALSTISNAASASTAISKLPFKITEVPKIKKIFNAYADNIFYSPESGRENKYLRGGATPTNNQSNLYLLRNAIIDSLLMFDAEVAYVNNGNDDGELEQIGKELNRAIVDYKASM